VVVLPSAKSKPQNLSHLYVTKTLVYFADGYVGC